MKQQHSDLDRRARSTFSFVLVQKRFAKISAVEDIALTTIMKKRVADFDKKGLSAEERRTSIIRAYRKRPVADVS